MNWLKINTINPKKQNLEKNVEDLEKEIPDTSKFIETHVVNRLTEINVNTIIAEAQKNLQLKTCR